MSRASSATLNYQLTNLAIGLLNDLRDATALAQRLAPIVNVPGASGQYKIFDDVNSFQVYNTARDLGGDPARIAFAATDGTYDCKPQALEVTIDEEERRRAGMENAIAQQLLDEGKIRALVNGTSLSHVNKVVAAVLAAVSAVAGRGVWSSPDIDPIDQIDEQLLALSADVGSTQNIMIDMDTAAWYKVRANAKVKARCVGVQVATVTEQQFVAALLFPVNFKVSNIVKNTAALGQTVSKARVLASECLIHYSVPNPTQYDASAFKTFTVGGTGQVVAVRSYSSPNGLYDGHFCDWSEDIKQTGSLCMKRLTIT